LHEKKGIDGFKGLIPLKKPVRNDQGSMDSRG